MSPFRRIKRLAEKATTTADKYGILADEVIDLLDQFEAGTLRVKIETTGLIPPTFTFGLVSEGEDGADE